MSKGFLIRKKISSLPGVEPGIFCSVGRRVIHCATNPLLGREFEKYKFLYCIGVFSHVLRDIRFISTLYIIQFIILL